MCMVFQCLMAVQNSVSSIWADDLYGAQAQRFDMISAVVLIMSVVIFHVIMVIVMAVKVYAKYSFYATYLVLMDFFYEFG